MDLTLTRTQIREDGIFGELTDENHKLIAYTLEHAFDDGNGSWAPKTPAGTYTCKRGQHQLHSMKVPFETFEITNVPNHTNILIHMGNWNEDSDGCCLVGAAIVQSSKGQMVSNSKEIFAEFMDLEKDNDEFQLTVI